MSVRPGTRLDGRYRLSDRLAYGGMGEVWRATDEVLSREVAVKILRPELAEDEAFVRRFRAEARTTSGLPHNGIAAVYDYGETRVGADGQSPAAYNDEDADPVAYLVMELVPGEALSSILSRDGALSPDLTLDLVAQAARALHAAHLRGVIHRDIKPANLMVTPDGRVKVTDFGIARPLDHEPLTATGQVMGTAHYLAPELAKGQDASPLSDVYALGVVAYECLAGHRPFEGDNQVAVALAHLNEQPPPLPGTIPEPVRAVVGSAMEKDPNRRMPSAEAFAAALETLRFRQNGNDDHLTPGTGILPGTAAAQGLAAAGLFGSAWQPGAHGSHAAREGPAIGAAMAPPPVPATLPPPGTHLLGPAVPRNGGGPGGQGVNTAPGMAANGGAPPRQDTLLGGYSGHDPFRTPTAPGGIPGMPGGYGEDPPSRRSFGPLIALAALAVVVVVVMLVAYLSGAFGNSGANPLQSETPTTAPPATSSAPTTSPAPTTITTSSHSRHPSSTTKSSTHSTTSSTTSSSTTTSSTTTTSTTTTTTTTSPTTTPPKGGTTTSPPAPGGGAPPPAGG